jgi:flagellar basal-body rod protein FlgB
MDVSTTDLFGLAERKLNWLEGRQRVLAQNIANADTPNYQSHDERKHPVKTAVRLGQAAAAAFV